MSTETPRAGWPISPGFVWRAGFIVMALVFIFLLIRFFLEDGGGVIFTVLMSWFFALAMAPAVNVLSKRMRRGLATLIVMGGVALFLVAFFAAFGALLVDQIIEIVESVPVLAAQGLEWFNQNFGQSYTAEELLAQVNLDQEALKQIAADAAKGIFGFAVSLIGGIFGLFTFGLLAFYLSADGPRLRRYLATMLPTQSQSVFLNVWDITADKTGRYVAARAILAAVNSFCSGIVFAIIGLPYWLPLALWTGIVAQFVPTIGTYISIILPVIVGLLSGNPWLGLIVLVYALIYQQIENLTIEPKISARAVDVHPAYGFVSVLLGASLFGIAGALLAIPVGAMALALVQIYVKRHDLVEEAELSEPPEQLEQELQRGDPG
ncbi:MAG: AI-2E family transporter [Candidatus Nanopelagicales bacterium]|nr:AI-2E family transporter [Candidatus Nanopelagicales bacterium]